MADFRPMLEGFSKLAVKMAGLRSADISQAHMPSKFIDPEKKGRLEFRVIACRPINREDDEIREEYDVATNKLIVTSHGLRELTIQVKFVGMDQRPGQDALFYLERVGDRIVFPGNREALRAIGLGLIRRESYLDLSKVLSAEDRQNSVGVKDFVFRAVVSEEMDSSGDSPNEWIEFVDFESDTLDDEGGTPLAPELQVSGTIVLT